MNSVREIRGAASNMQKIDDEERQMGVRLALGTPTNQYTRVPRKPPPKYTPPSFQLPQLLSWRALAVAA